MIVIAMVIGALLVAAMWGMIIHSIITGDRDRRARHDRYWK